LKKHHNNFKSKSGSHSGLDASIQAQKTGLKVSGATTRLIILKYHPFTKHGWTNLPVPASPISLLNTKVWRIWVNSPYKRIGKQTVRYVNWIGKLLHLNYYCLMMVEMFIRSQKGTLFKEIQLYFL
jgi:hypothetical protein